MVLVNVWSCDGCRSCWLIPPAIHNPNPSDMATHDLLLSLQDGFSSRLNMRSGTRGFRQSLAFFAFHRRFPTRLGGAPIKHQRHISLGLMKSETAPGFVGPHHQPVVRVSGLGLELSPGDESDLRGLLVQDFGRKLTARDEKTIPPQHGLRLNVISN